jgi:hypothetical protein
VRGNCDISPLLFDGFVMLVSHTLKKEKYGTTKPKRVRTGEILAGEHLRKAPILFCTTDRRYHMDSTIQFLESVSGRTVRVILGIVLLALGIFLMHGVWGIVVDIIGIIVLVAGLFGILLLAPLFGYTMTGEKRAGHAGS